MGYVRLNDDAIWVTRIEGDATLRSRLSELPAGRIVELEVAGVAGLWEKMRQGRDGRPTPGIKPIGAMRDTWKEMQSRRGEIVEIREIALSDVGLASLRPYFSEWESPEDEEAFRDL